MWPIAVYQERPPSKSRAPGDRVVVVDGVAVLLAVGRLVDGREHLHVAGPRAEVGDRRAAVDDRGRRVLEVVPLVHARPGGGQAGGGGLVGVLDVDGRGRRSGRVRAEVAADQLAVPRPRVLGVGRGVDAGVAAAGLDEALERRLLRVVEHLAGRREEHDDVVLREVRVGERRGVLGRGHGEVVRRAELLDRGDPLRDRVVPEAARLGEDEHVLERARLLGARGSGRPQPAHQRDDDREQHDASPAHGRSLSLSRLRTARRRGLYAPSWGGGIPLVLHAVKRRNTT